MFLRELLRRSWHFATIFFISEAWMSKAKKEGIPSIPPSHDPQRREVVIVVHQGMQLPTQERVIYEMKPNSNGRVTLLEQMKSLKEEEKTAYYSPLMEAFISGFFGNTSNSND